MRNIVLVLLLVPVIVNVAFHKDCFAKPPTAKNLLWEISGNGLGQPSYIFGTIHEGCAKQLALSVEQGAALARTRQLYTETSYASSKSVDKSLKEKKQRLLKDLIKPNQYKIIEDFFGKSYLDFEQSQKSEPRDLIASLLIAIRKEATYKFFGRRCTEITSKERVLIAAANRHGIKLDGIETNNDRSNVLQDTSFQMMVDQLVSMIDEYLTSPDSVDEKLAESQRYYIDQDIYAMSISSDAADDILQKPLVEERNRLWILRMQNGYWFRLAWRLYLLYSKGLQRIPNTKYLFP
jgi:uncharacterized protein